MHVMMHIDAWESLLGFRMGRKRVLKLYSALIPAQRVEQAVQDLQHVEVCLNCSSKTLRMVTDIFHYALKVRVYFPTFRFHTP